jgi:hypothetical protein
VVLGVFWNVARGGQELMVVGVAMDVAARKSGYMYDAVDLVTKVR